MNAENRKTVMITGADRGVGFSLCECFLENGWFVFAGPYMPEWKQLTELLEQYPEQLKIIPLDVGNTVSVRSAAELVGEFTNHVDLLVNCAGISRGDMHDIINVNVTGALRTVELFLPLMQRGMKRIAFFSSECGSIAVSHRNDGFAYPVSKTALNMTVRHMFRALQPKGYTFRLYHPGWVRSYMSGQKSTVGNFEPEEAAEVAYRQFTEDFEVEDILVMRDISGEMWPY